MPLTEEQKKRIEAQKSLAAKKREEKHRLSVDAIAVAAKESHSSSLEPTLPQGWVEDPSDTPSYPSSAALKATKNDTTEGWAGFNGRAVTKEALQGVQRDPRHSALISQGSGLEK